MGCGCGGARPQGVSVVYHPRGDGSPPLTGEEAMQRYGPGTAEYVWTGPGNRVMPPEHLPAPETAPV